MNALTVTISTGRVESNWLPDDVYRQRLEELQAWIDSEKKRIGHHQTAGEKA